MAVHHISRFLKDVFAGFGLRGRLLRHIGGAVAAIFVVIAWLTYNRAATNLQQQAIQTGHAQAKAAAREVDGYLQTAARFPEQVSQLVTGMPSLTKPQLSEAEHALLGHAPADQAYDIYVYWDSFNHLDQKDAQVGISRDSWPNLMYDDPSYDFHQQAWYTGTKSALALYVAEPYYDLGATNRAMISLVVPNLRNGRFAGVTGVDLTLDRISDVLRDVHFASDSSDNRLASFALLSTG